MSVYMRLINTIRNGRLCMYCNHNEHDITQCNSSSLYEYYLVLVQKKYDIMDHQSSLTLVEMMRVYLLWLTTLSPNIIICCARRFCASHTIIYSECLTNVIIKIWNNPNPSREEIEYIPFNNEIFDYTYNHNNNNSECEKTIIQVDYNENKNNNSCEVDTSECVICYETTPQNKMVLLNCKHSFCYKCIIESKKNNTNRLCCAICREKIINIQCTNSDVKNILDNL